MRLTLAGAAVGSAASFILARVAQGVVPESGGWNLRLVTVSAAVIIGAAALAAWLPARRAGAVDPMVVLRND